MDKRKKGKANLPFNMIQILRGGNMYQFSNALKSQTKTEITKSENETNNNILIFILTYIDC